MLPLFQPANDYNQPPGPDEIEVSVIGPGFGEAVFVHVGAGAWFTIDSCVERGVSDAATLRYMADIAVDPSQVFLNVITHWDDDHCKGLSQLVSACSGAEVSMPSSFTQKDFLRFASAYNKPLTRHAKSGVSEIMKTMKVLQEAGRTSIKYAAADTRLLTRGSSELGATGHVELWALSPSHFEYSNFLSWIAQQLPTVGETRTVAVHTIRNNLSIVLHLSIGSNVLLFGGDLEETGNPARGWSAILASSGRPTAPAQLFKVPHHGSVTGHHDEIWSHLLASEPISVIAPFRHGNVSLPSSSDIARVKSRSAAAYGSTDLTSLNAPKFERSVQKTIGEVVTKYNTIKPKLGMVRARKKMDEAAGWKVELFGGAIKF